MSLFLSALLLCAAYGEVGLEERAHAAYASSDWPQAAEAFARLSLRRPEDPSLLVNLANSQFMGGDPAAALTTLRSRPRVLGDFVDAHFSEGYILWSLRKHDAAAAAYRRVLDLRPDHVSAANNLGTALKDGGHLDEAAAAYDAALKLTKVDADLWYNSANVLKELGRFQDAVQHYERSIALHDGVDAEAEAALADALTRSALAELGDPEDDMRRAESALRRAVAAVEAHVAAGSNSKTALPNANAHIRLGELVSRQLATGARVAKDDDALKLFERACELVPRSAEAAAALGRALHDRRRLSEAAAQYRRALDFGGASEAVVRVNLLGVLADLARSDTKGGEAEREAIEMARAAVVAAPHDATAHASLASLLYALGPKFEHDALVAYRSASAVVARMPQPIPSRMSVENSALTSGIVSERVLASRTLWLSLVTVDWRDLESNAARLSQVMRRSNTQFCTDRRAGDGNVRMDSSSVQWEPLHALAFPVPEIAVCV